jgi:NarL family two-component system response regulator LiaR
MKNLNTIRLMIADDHLMVRDGLKVFLSVYDDIEVVSEAQDGNIVLDKCAQSKPDVILMDIVMPGMDGPTAIRLVREKYPQIQVIALTSFIDPKLVQRALKAGAISYILKDVHAAKLAEAIREAYHGRGTIDSAAAQSLVSIRDGTKKLEFDLTPREQEILILMVEGKPNKEIAQDLTISLGTVRFHVSNILSKMGVKNRTEAVSAALKYGLVQGD